MPKKNLDEKINAFRVTYGVQVDAEFLTNTAKMQYLDTYFFQTQQGTLEQSTYLKGLNKILTAYIESRIEMSGTSSYSLADLYIPEMIQDYEEIIAEQNANAATPKERNAYEGMEFEDVLKRTVNGMAKYNLPVGELWGKKILDNKLTVEDLEEMVDSASADLSVAKSHDFKEHDRRNLKNVLMAKQAMEKVRKGRGFFWKLFNFRKNGAEKEFLQRLTDLETIYVSENFPVNSVLGEISESVMKPAVANAKGYQQRQDAKNAELESRKSNVAAKAAAVIAGEQYQEMTAKELGGKTPEEKFAADLLQELKDRLPQSEYDEKTLELLYSTMVARELLTKAQEANKKFDKAISEGTDPKKAMEGVVNTMLERAAPLAYTLGYTSREKQLAAAQIITDVVLNKVSPAAFNKEKFGEFANCYVIKNSNTFWATLSHQNLESQKTVDGAQVIYDEMQQGRENVIIEGFDLNNNVPKSEPVPATATIADPTKTLSN